MAVIISDTCMGCETCIPNCQYNALKINSDGKLIVNNERCTECGKCVSECPISALKLPVSKKDIKDTITIENKKSENPKDTALKVASDVDEHNCGVWVFAEQLEGKLNSVTLELIGEAKKLGLKLNVPVSAILLGDNIESIIPVLFEYGADKIYTVNDPVYHFYRAETYKEAFCYLINKYNPEILLIGATTTGRDLAGAVATTLRTGLTADCTILDIDMDKKILLASRPAFGGNIMATIVCKDHRPQMATVRPRVMQMAVPQPLRSGLVVNEIFKIEEDSLQTKVLKVVKEKIEDLKLEDAKIIVGGGRGIQNEQGFKLLSEFAKLIGGVVAGSRGAVEKGLIDSKYQVGQTGQTVCPKLYFAIGISGAIQHIVGMQGAETIVAINTDPDCPMMKLATYGIVGDAFEILTKLTDGFKDILDDNPRTKVDNVCSI